MVSLVLICLIIVLINVTKEETLLEWELVIDFPSSTTSNFMCGYDSSNDTIWILMDKLNTSPDQVYSLNPNTNIFTSYNTFTEVTTGNCQFYTSTTNKLYAVWSTDLYIFDMVQQSETFFTNPFDIPNSGYCITIHPSNQYLFSIVPGWSSTNFTIYRLYTNQVLHGPLLNYSSPGVAISCTVSLYNNYLYVFMGTSIHKIFVGDEANYVPQVVDNPWITLNATLTTWLECSQIVQINEQIYIIGGSKSFSESKNIDIVNVSDDTVKAGTPLNIARSRGCATYASKSNSIYVFGGANYGRAEGQQSYEIGMNVVIPDTTLDIMALSSGSSSSLIFYIIIIVVAGLLVFLSVLVYFMMMRKKRAKMTRQLDATYKQATVMHEVKQEANYNHHNVAVTKTTQGDGMAMNEELPPAYTRDDGMAMNEELPPAYTVDDGIDDHVMVSAPPEDSLNGKQQYMKEWLINVVGLPQYIEIFIQNGFDGDCVVHITKDELKEMNILLGHQVKIMAAVNQMKQILNNDSDVNHQPENYKNEGGETVQFQ